MRNPRPMADRVVYVVTVCAVLSLASALAPSGSLHAVHEPSAPPRAGSRAAAPPAFPDAYEMEWDFLMPYFMVLQPHGFK